MIQHCIPISFLDNVFTSSLSRFFVNCRFHLAVGSLYVREHFNRKSKAAVNEAFEDIRAEFRDNLQTVSWMDNKTRAAAIHKVNRMSSHVGYADELLDDKKLEEFYAVLDIHPDKFFRSILSINGFFTEKQFKLLREPVNKTLWYLYESPTTVNAFYDSNRNGIGAYLCAARCMV